MSLYIEKVSLCQVVLLTSTTHLRQGCQGARHAKGGDGEGGREAISEGGEGGWSEESSYEMCAVDDAGSHVDAVGEDEPHAAKESREEEGGGEEHQGKQQHRPVVPAGRELLKRIHEVERS